MAYELLEAYRQGQLSQIWQDMKIKIGIGDRQLSPIRAGEIAAALLANRAANELANLEEDSKTDDTMLDLLEWLIDNYQINGDLVALSGTRTLIADRHIYPLPVEDDPSSPI